MRSTRMRGGRAFFRAQDSSSRCSPGFGCSTGSCPYGGATNGCAASRSPPGRGNSVPRPVKLHPRPARSRGKDRARSPLRERADIQREADMKTRKAGAIRIGGGSGFLNDRVDAALELVEKGDIDVLMMETLAERT